MNLPGEPAGGPDGPSADPLESALRAWTPPPLADAGFTQAVLQRLANRRARPGLAPADAVQRLRAREQREARQARLTGLGLVLGLALAVGWLLAFSVWPGDRSAVADAWLPWLGAALAGLAGALAWLTQQWD